MQNYNSEFKDSVMKENDFFKKYSAQYSKKVQVILKNNFGKKLNENIKLNAKAPTYDKKILVHIGEQSIYRKKLPQLFTGKGYDNTKELQDEMQTKFRPVPLPPDLVKRQAAFENITGRNSPSYSP